MQPGLDLSALTPPLRPATEQFVQQWGQLALPPPLVAPCALEATDVIASTDPAVVVVANEVAGHLPDQASKALALFTFVRDAIRYDIGPDLPNRSAWHAGATLQRGKGFCQQKAVLLAALLRAQAIPSGLGFEHIRDWKLQGTRFEAILPEGVIIYHGLTYAFLHGGWRAMDATLDRALSEKRGYQLVQASPTAHALLPALDLAGNRHFDRFGHWGPYCDLPHAVSGLLVSVQATWAEARTLARSGATM